MVTAYDGGGFNFILYVSTSVETEKAIGTPKSCQILVAGSIHLKLVKISKPIDKLTERFFTEITRNKKKKSISGGLIIPLILHRKTVAVHRFALLSVR